PPTLIASIFGMNYRYIPFLETEWGFWLSLVLMVLAGAVPLIIFKLKRYI
ncbi:MAG: magnesium transporter CorA, partial [Akkermansia sp.]|nr:magnesium transporter CorA [Akkermansia sp.]